MIPPITELSEIRAHNINAIMKNENWNFKQMADATGLSPQTIGNVTSKKQNVSKKTARAIVLKLGIAESWFDSDNRKSRSPAPQYSSRVEDEGVITSVVPKVHIRIWNDSGTMDINMEVPKDKAVAFLTGMINDE